MDTNAPKTPATLPLAAWQAMTPGGATHEIHRRAVALSVPLRRAALAWLRPEMDLAMELSSQANGAAQPLRGVPYMLKDLFDLAEVPTRAGSVFLDKVRPTPKRDSHIALRLRQLGASCAGKTHLVEFASGLTGENPHYGDCPHPRFPDRLTGGSSSGSAAMVAAGVVPLAIGTDTGGSVRVPAAWCGLHGFRLTPGDDLISDAFPLAPTMDSAGWFTANAADMLTVWAALVSSSRRETAGTTSGLTTAATPRGLFLRLSQLLPGADKEVDEACARSAASWAHEADPPTIRELLDTWRDGVEAYITIGMSEAHAVHRNWLAPYREHYDPVIWQRFSDAGHYPAEKIARARATLETVRAGWRKFFATYDFLVLPAVPGPAPRKVDCTPELRRSILTLTAPASLGGLPVLSLPVALPSGLTAGLQIIVPAANSPVVPWILKNQK